MRQPKKGRLWLNDGSCVRLRLEYRNHVWSYGFVHCRTDDGKAFCLGLPEACGVVAVPTVVVARLGGGMAAGAEVRGVAARVVSKVAAGQEAAG